MSFQNEENKLDWMYKSSTSLVNREDYLLGRKIDKSLEKLNTEEKEKELGISVPKNHVEHECIPPSIRDYNRLQATEQQVDIATKLQEDPLVAIKKREEETRKQFLQNPIQLKKIQTLLDKQMKKKKKKKKSKSSKSSKDIDTMILEKLQSVKNGTIDIDSMIQQEEAKLDKLLRKKFRKYKEKLADEDLQEVIDLKDVKETKPPVEENNDSDDNDRKRWKPKPSYRQKFADRNRRYVTSEDETDTKRRGNNDSDDDRKQWKPKSSYRQSQNYPERHKRKIMTEDEKEAKRREMMNNASWRDKERELNVKRYKDQDVKEAKQQDFKEEFAHRELLKSANHSTLESRIKSNVNNIQRSRGAMDKNFSRR